MSTTYYYRMKINSGNTYYQYFKSNNTFGGLWIGWPENDLIRVRQMIKEKKSKNANENELARIIQCVEENQTIRRIIFLWDRECQKICFWEIHGNNFLPVTSNIDLNISKETELHIKNGNIIPARHLKSISRSSFPAFIDSLSVYAYLNNGTFRALANVGQLKRNDLGFFKKRNGKESEFSLLVGKYFDWILSAENKTFAEFAGLTNDQIEKIVLNYMSPAQLETFGSLLLIDLGFTLELGVGKSLNDIDLRASYRHHSKDQYAAIFNNIKKKITNVLGVNMSDQMLNTIEKSQTIFVQCKDYASTTQDERILFLSQSQNNTQNCINLNVFTDQNIDLSKNFPLVSDWVKQATSFFHTPLFQLNAE